MPFIRAIAMWVDHTYYGKPIEMGRVDLYCSASMTPEEIELAKKIQDKRLHSMAKVMPYKYWLITQHKIIAKLEDI